MRLVCSSHAMEWSAGCKTEEAKSSAFGIKGRRSMYPSVDRCSLIKARLPKQGVSPQVRSDAAPLFVCVEAPSKFVCRSPPAIDTR